MHAETSHAEHIALSALRAASCMRPATTGQPVRAGPWTHPLCAPSYGRAQDMAHRHTLQPCHAWVTTRSSRLWSNGRRAHAHPGRGIQHTLGARGQAVPCARSPVARSSLACAPICALAEQKYTTQAAMW